MKRLFTLLLFSIITYITAAQCGAGQTEIIVVTTPGTANLTSPFYLWEPVNGGYFPSQTSYAVGSSYSDTFCLNNGVNWYLHSQMWWGWNGAAIDVYQGTQLLGSYTSGGGGTILDSFNLPIASTLVCNPDTNGMTVTNIGSTSAILKWTADSATAFKVKWRLYGTTTWSTTNVNVNQQPGSNILVDTLMISSLLPDTMYEWRVRSFGCSPNYWVDGPSFTTLSICNGVNINSSITSINASCASVSNGSATLSVSGGNAPYSFAWSSGDTTQNLVGVATGPYYVTITDNLGCTQNDTAIIGFGNISSNITVTDASCLNTNINGMIIPVLDGSATLSVTGGNTPYSFAWNSGDTTQNLVGVASGTYYVTITGDQGCTQNDTAIIGFVGNQSLTQQLTAFSPNPVTAYHQWSYDTLRITNTGCDVRIRPEFKISCSAGNIQQGDLVIKYQHPGGWNQFLNYSIDANGDAYGYWSFVQGDSTGYEVPLGQIADVIVQVKFVNPALFGTYTSTWMTYQVDSIGNRLDTLAGPTNVILSLQSVCANFINGVNFTSTNISCNGANDGTATVLLAGAGGSTPASFTGSYCNSGPTQNNYSNIELVSLTGDNTAINNNTAGACDMYEDYSNMSADLTPGQTYNMSVILSSGPCPSTNLLYFQDIAKIFIDWNIDGDFDDQGEEVQTIGPFQSPSTKNFSFTVPSSASVGNTRMRVVAQNYTYNNNSTTFGACHTSAYFGATEDYSIVISASMSVGPVNISWSNGATTDSLTGLSAGMYIATVSDTNNCQLTDTIIITDPPVISVSDSLTHVNCFGGNDGIANLTLGGGSGPLSQNWGGMNPNALPAGTHSYMITDTNNCTFSGSVTISEPQILTTSTNINHISCVGANDGSVTLYISGGTTDYTVNAFGSTYSLSGGIDTVASSTFFPSGLSADTVLFSITDANGCSTNDTAIINEPSALSILKSINNVSSCGLTDGSINLTIGGGTFPYTYYWTGPNGFSSTNEDISSLEYGQYTIIVSDSNNCTIFDTVIITQPSNNLSVTTTTSSYYGGYQIGGCNGSNNGFVNAVVSGGTPGFSYTWSGANGFVSNTLSITAIPAGSYILTVTDTNNCQVISNVIMNEPTAISISDSITNVSCNGGNTGKAILTLSGGISPLIEDWGILNPNALSAGIHAYTITDSSGCTVNGTVNITEPDSLKCPLSINHISCNGSNDGLVSTSVSGGTAPYSFSWSNGFTRDTIFNLIAGMYSLTVSDANSCSIFIDSIVIHEPALLSFTIDSIQDVIHIGTNTGAINISSYGGNPSYNYSWSGPNNFTANTEDLDSIPAGIYTLYMSDSLGCDTSTTITINEPNFPPILILKDSIVHIDCYGNSTGAIFITPTGGDSSYIYNWSNGDTTQNLLGVTKGSYYLTITDGAGNSLDSTLHIITEPDSLEIQINVTNAPCYGGNGLVTLAILGGMPSFSYQWSSGNNTSSITQPAGIYTISVTDSNNCSISDTVTIEEADSLVVNISTTNASCYGLNDGSITVNVISGGTLPFIYSKDNGINFQPNTPFYNLAADTFDIVVRDDNHCMTYQQIIISAPEPLYITVLKSDASCYGYCDATASLLISGGTPGYTEDWGGVNPLALCAGLVNISVSDTNGCIATTFTTINEPPPIIVNISQNGNVLDVGGGFVSYQWLDDNLDTIIGSTLQQFTVTATGEYSVIVEDSNGCQATSFPMLILVDSQSEIDAVFNIYPNPTNGEINIQYRNLKIESLIIFDLYGRIVVEELNIKSEMNSFRLNLSNLPKNQYILQIHTDSKVINHSLILQ